MKIWTCGGHVNLSKIEEICPLAIPNRISTISMHTPFGENPMMFTRYRPETKYGQTEGRTTDGQTANTIPQHPTTNMWRGIKRFKPPPLVVFTTDCSKVVFVFLCVALAFIITKTCLFKYIGNFTSKN